MGRYEQLIPESRWKTTRGRPIRTSHLRNETNARLNESNPIWLFSVSTTLRKHTYLSKGMHDEDNKKRLFATNASNQKFRLIGESMNRDDFNKLQKGANDQDMAILLQLTKTAVNAAVQQVIDAGGLGLSSSHPKFKEVSQHLPRIEIFWESTDQKTNTYELKIQPAGIKSKIPEPKYKIKAEYSSTNGFVNPILFEPGTGKSWRNCLKLFTPGKGRAWWIPDDPAKSIRQPK
jgi:hypothetical protein